MGRFINLAVLLSLSLTFCLFPDTISGQPRPNYYASYCSNVESIDRKEVTKKFKKTFVTGCDASVMIASSGGNKAEKDHPDNLSLAGDGFNTVIKAKAAVDAVPGCRNKVSCADIMAMATRDAIALSGGPSYAVELGRLDGLNSTAASVNGKLPQSFFNLNQLNSLFAGNGLSQADMIALSGFTRLESAHTVGFSHCSKFSNRIYGFDRQNTVDPAMNRTNATQLQQMCPQNVDPTIPINMDPDTPRIFDNVYFKNLQKGQGLFTSDQILFTDLRSRPTVNAWATVSQALNQAFVTAITKLGRVGVKTGTFVQIVLPLSFN
ncbi:Peroxidase 35 [Hibiscus syriacus]|uniref:Peroxidase n=1 Tax=Hibiscus syriacus TaxID=106335 RepID=A0A6A3AE88_HIBSY|nr:Peroxidase 35 [Hibiscus syriacus]